MKFIKSISLQEDLENKTDILSNNIAILLSIIDLKGLAKGIIAVGYFGHLKSNAQPKLSTVGMSEICKVYK